MKIIAFSGKKTQKNQPEESKKAFSREPICSFSVKTSAMRPWLIPSLAAMMWLWSPAHLMSQTATASSKVRLDRLAVIWLRLKAERKFSGVTVNLSTAVTLLRGADGWNPFRALIISPHTSTSLPLRCARNMLESNPKCCDLTVLYPLGVV